MFMAYYVTYRSSSKDHRAKTGYFIFVTVYIGIYIYCCSCNNVAVIDF